MLLFFEYHRVVAPTQSVKTRLTTHTHVLKSEQRGLSFAQFGPNRLILSLERSTRTNESCNSRRATRKSLVGRQELPFQLLREGIVLGRSDRSRDWFIQTPAVIVVSDGQVTACGEDQVAQFHASQPE